MPIEMPPLSKLHKQREGATEFTYKKLIEVVNVVNALTESETSTITISVKDDNTDGVEGAKVTLTSGGVTYSSKDTGSAGGSSIKNVPYGIYTVNVIAPEGYTALVTYDNLTVNSTATTLAVTVNKNAVETTNTT